MEKYNHGLFSISQIRECERKAINYIGITEIELMQRAGLALLRVIKKFFPDAQTIAIFCGSGNNAGDGYVLAKLAYMQGLAPIVYQFKAIDELPYAAQVAAQDAINHGINCQMFEDQIEPEIDLIVDGLLGIGINGEVQNPIAHAIDLINSSDIPVLAIDIPSGLDADTGQVLGTCVNANLTVTFIAKKRGLFTLEGPDHAGEIVCDSLQLEECIESVNSTITVLNSQLFTGVIPARKKNSYKDKYGRLLIIGSGPGMLGATYLTALAAARTGAGVVNIATLPEHAKNVLPMLPEVMVHGISEGSDIEPLLEKSSVIIIGPGLGESEWAQDLFNIIITTQLPLVIDASALRLLAHDPQYDDDWILTPHPGEAAALLNLPTADIQQDRFQAAEMIQQKYGGVVVLKGVGTIINDGVDHSICTIGNPGMASAGMGDTLSGIIASLIGQGVSLTTAAKLGVWLHAKAADEAASSHGERGLLASDLIPFLRQLINQI